MSPQLPLQVSNHADSVELGEIFRLLLSAIKVDALAGSVTLILIN